MWLHVLGFYPHAPATNEETLERYPGFNSNFSLLYLASFINEGMKRSNNIADLIWVNYAISSTMNRTYAQISSFDLPHLTTSKN